MSILDADYWDSNQRIVDYTGEPIEIFWTQDAIKGCPEDIVDDASQAIMISLLKCDAPLFPEAWCKYVVHVITRLVDVLNIWNPDKTSKVIISEIVPYMEKSGYEYLVDIENQHVFKIVTKGRLPVFNDMCKKISVSI